MNASQSTCQTCHATLVYRNGATPGTGTPPMNASGSGRDRSLVCDAVRRTGLHAAEYYGEALVCDAPDCILRADWQAEISGPRFCAAHAPSDESGSAALAVLVSGSLLALLLVVLPLLASVVAGVRAASGGAL